jgi:hypothetical protein
MTDSRETCALNTPATRLQNHKEIFLVKKEETTEHTEAFFAGPISLITWSN